MGLINLIILMLFLLALPHPAYAMAGAEMTGADFESFCVKQNITHERCMALKESLAKMKGKSLEEVRSSLAGMRELKGLSRVELNAIAELAQEEAASKKLRDKMKKLEEKDAHLLEKKATENPEDKPEEKPEASLFDRYLEPGVPASERLKPFGYEVFRPDNASPSQDLPVASDYVIGPGDEISVLLWGRVSGQHELIVSREGTVLFPNVGDLSVGGMTYQELKQFLKRKAASIIGAEISVTMSKLRSVQVFVLGEVKRPGAYDISAMSTVANALMEAGGPSGIGTLRRVELKRADKTVTTLDLYKLLLSGDKSGDVRVRNGDVIFVPTVGPLVGVDGNVRRPGVYELNGASDLESVLGLAGGMLPAAYTQRVQVERFEKDRGRISVDIDMNTMGRFRMRDGDMVRVFPVSEKDLNAVYLKGAVKRPGTYELKEGMRLKDVITGEDGLQTGAYLGYCLVKRVARPEGEVRFIAVNLEKLLKGSVEDNIALQPGDTIQVFSKWSFMDKPTVSIEGEIRCKEALGPDVKKKEMTGKLEEKELKKEGEAGFPKDVQSLRPGEEKDASSTWRGADEDDSEKSIKGCSFEIPDILTVKDLVLMAGGLTADAYMGEFEIYRTDPDTREVTLHKFDLKKAMAGNAGDNDALMPRDRVVIHSAREMAPKKYVTISGDVNRPGKYEYSSNMRVSDLVFAAGSLLDSAFLEEAELAGSVVEKGKSFQTDYTGINLRKALEGDRAHDLPLSPYDTLFVKRIPGWGDQMHVALEGEVRFPGRYIVKKGERLSSLIERAGGFTGKAYLKGAVFTRESIRQAQQKNLEESISRLEYSLLSGSISSLEKSTNPEEAEMLQASAEQKKALIAKLRLARATGRISVRIERPEQLKGGNSDILLEDGDVLTVPKIPTQVQIVGSVYNQTAFLYEPDGTVSYYLKKAGGFTREADEDEIYILKSDGTALKEVESSWLSWDSKGRQWVGGGLISSRLDPGDTIVVPEKIDRVAWIKEAKDLTQILYQIAVTAGVLIVAF